MVTNCIKIEHRVMLNLLLLKKRSFKLVSYSAG